MGFFGWRGAAVLVLAATAALAFGMQAALLRAARADARAQADEVANLRAALAGQDAMVSRWAAEAKARDAAAVAALDSARQASAPRRQAAAKLLALPAPAAGVDACRAAQDEFAAELRQEREVKP